MADLVPGGEEDERNAFASAVRSAQDLAGVFEHDGETAYFYLYGLGEQPKVLDHIHIYTGTEPATRVLVVWDRAEEVVGLFLRDVLTAAYQVQPRAKISRRDQAETLDRMKERFDLD